ncbi:hypothetical protein ACJ3XI_00825 [Litorimonas sp. RW-G-Af-16]|uniref:hypothetical protein n=1 Tax=Litorimonas sp. RW-G-Af-16 TaxID=3241168 RepID=UPI00390C43D9
MTRSRLVSLLAVLATSAFTTTAMAGPSQLPSLVPANPNAGECYARVKIPAQYTTSREAYVSDQAHTQLQVRQARLQARQEAVMTKDAHTRYHVRQPRFQTVTDQILVRPAYDKLSVTPPQFQTIQENIQTSAPTLVWKKGNPAALRAQGYRIHSTAQSGGYGANVGGSDMAAFYGAGLGGQRCGEGCEIWCLVEEPGESRSITRRVMSNPGGVQRTPVPAKFQTITKQKLADPGGVEEIFVPAEFRTVTVEDIVEPARVSEVPVPDSYATVETRQMVSPERYEWRRVLCAPGTGNFGTENFGTGNFDTSNLDTGSGQSGQHSQSHYSAPTYSSHTQSQYSGQNATHNTYSEGTQYNYQSGYYGTDNYPAYQRTPRAPLAHPIVRGDK